MNIYRIGLPMELKVLFVWDGTAKFISSADRFVRILHGHSVHVVHALPHASIDGAAGSPQTQEKSIVQKRLEKAFRRQADGSRFLQDSSFELLLGDRVNEIVVMAAQLQAKFILMPKFEQSTFSKWIHGDLNEKIRAKATCPVIFLDAERPKTIQGDVAAGIHQDRS